MSPDISNAIRIQFIGYVARLKGGSQAEHFLSELLTESEQTMLAKRFAIIIMLARGNSFTDIEEALKVSSSTIAHIWRKQKQGAYSYVLEKILPNRKMSKSACDREFIAFLEVLVRAGMPPIVGKGRWKFLNEVLPITSVNRSSR